jgi:hypothetical protein
VAIDYKTSRFEEVAKDQDVVFDTQAGETLLRSFESVKSGGVVVTIGGRPDGKFACAWGLSLPLVWILGFLNRKVDRLARKKGARFEYLFMRASGFWRIGIALRASIQLRCWSSSKSCEESRMGTRTALGDGCVVGHWTCHGPGVGRAGLAGFRDRQIEIDRPSPNTSSASSWICATPHRSTPESGKCWKRRAGSTFWSTTPAAP